MRSHKLEIHKCGIKNCKIGFRKIYLYVTAIYANRKNSYQSLSDKYLAKQRAEKELKREKSDKNKEKINDISMMHSDIDKKNARY